MEIIIYPPFFPTDKDEPAKELVHNALEKCTFKGLESDMVFSADTDKMKSNDRRVLYTQARRARFSLGLLGKNFVNLICDNYKNLAIR